jgi:UDP-2,4-diacetamido-2,4,6-trideoxy-beta-L-altropyranose hydrolase
MRVDAAPAIGGGHVMRCLALADALAEEGWTITFAVTPETPQTVAALRESAYGWISLSSSDDPAVFKAAITGGCDLLVIDHYGLDSHYEAACRGFAKRILVIDDLADRNHDCDILLDPTLGRDVNVYQGRIPESAHIFAGPLYALLRPSFAAVRSEGLRQRTTVRRILFSMGATDAGSHLAPLLEAASGLASEIDVVVGSSARDLARVRTVAGKLRARVHIDTSNVASLMANADIAVLAAGTTTSEAACLGLAMVLLVAAGNQVEIAQAMAKRGAAVVAKSPADAVTLASQLIADSDRRIKMSRAASSVCDGLGARRMAIFLCPERDSEGRTVTLRPVSAGDADLILTWQEDPKTRRFARNPAVPTRPEHDLWLAQKLMDSNSVMHIVMCADKPAGLLRLDHSEASAKYEVSIVIAPDQHGRGIGIAALRLARRLMPMQDFSAYVLPGNEASRRLFDRAGYKASGGGWLAQNSVSKLQ